MMSHPGVFEHAFRVSAADIDRLGHVNGVVNLLPSMPRRYALDESPSDSARSLRAGKASGRTALDRDETQRS